MLRALLRQWTVSLVRRAQRLLPPIDDTDPIPLTHRNVENIQRQIRDATEQRPESRPPTPHSRYD